MFIIKATKACGANISTSIISFFIYEQGTSCYIMASARFSFYVTLIDMDATLEKYIPLDKSWMIRMGVLDMIHGYGDSVRVLSEEHELSDDLKSLTRSAVGWRSSGPIDVGESGTLYRFLRFASWKLTIPKMFIKRGTLAERPIVDDPRIVSLPITKLLELDGGTSQWASAAVLMGNEERVSSPPYKLALTREALTHWQKARREGGMWEIRRDPTIERQAEAFIYFVNGGRFWFEPEHSEDYCFARAFGQITPREGERRWPSLRGHESDRTREMEVGLTAYRAGEPIASRDHRVIQALSMRALHDGEDIRVQYPGVVAKSWPQFWDFMRHVSPKNI